MSVFSQPDSSYFDGRDPSLSYAELYQQSISAGIPWDDRNLDITSDELFLLPSKDSDDKQDIPLFYRIILRGKLKNLRTHGPCQYPRSALETFRRDFGGQLLFGERTQRPGEPGPEFAIDHEGPINNALIGAAESAVSINPVNTQLVIAGLNSPNGGQEMFYSSDGSATWHSAGILPGSCCDPTVAWSPDGTIAYTSTIDPGIPLYRSTDNGQTWTGPITVSSEGGVDKEYIHVDHAPSSPHKGNVYVTWHSGNVMKFARSTDNGLHFSPELTFTGSTGIGSDICSDADGKIFYFWPDFMTKTVIVAISSDGGASFGAPQVVAHTQVDYDYPIPAMDQRNAFLYLSCDVDLTDSPYHNRVYACWNDTLTDDDDNNASANHSRITFAYSSDGGSTWNFSTPHTTADMDKNDRFHPWFEVDNNGTIHVVYYDTRNDPSRRKTDFYYASSTDGGETWSTEERITSTQSNYISDFFQWGDYNGMSAVLDSVIPIWTDNRTSVNVYTAEIQTLAGQGDFEISANSLSQTRCQPGSIVPVTLDLSPLHGFSQAVDLSTGSMDTHLVASFSPIQITPPGSSTLQIQINAGTPAGLHSITIEGESSGGLKHDLTLNLFVRDNQISSRFPDWMNPATFDNHYDMDGDHLFTMLDLIALMDCGN